MHPRLQTAFDVMYPKAARFLTMRVADDATAAIKDGQFAMPAGYVAEALARATVTPSNAQAHRAAVAAFGEFWRVFTELSYGAAPANSPADKAAMFKARVLELGESMELAPHELHACTVALLGAVERAVANHAPLPEVRRATDDTLAMLRRKSDAPKGGN